MYSLILIYLILISISIFFKKDILIRFCFIVGLLIICVNIKHFNIILTHNIFPIIMIILGIISYIISVLILNHTIPIECIQALGNKNNYIILKAKIIKTCFTSIYEELLWRGTLLILRANYGIVLIASLIFSLLHFKKKVKFIEILYLFIWSLFQYLILLYTYNIVNCIIIHIIRNICVLLFQKTKKDLLSKGDKSNMGKKYDVLYIHPTKRLNDTLYSIMPMGIIGILNELKKKGFTVKGVNIAIEKFLNNDFNIEQFLKNIDYKVLLIDLHWYEHSHSTIQLAKISKKIKENIPIIIGGYTSTIYYQEILKEHTCIDYITLGDSEYPMCELVDYIINVFPDNKEIFLNIPNIGYRQNGKIFKTNRIWIQENINKLDFVNTNMFEHEEYIPYLTTTGVKKNIIPSYWLCIARGCKYDCAYCCGSNSNMSILFNRKKIILRNPTQVMKDIKFLANKGIMHICPSHDFQMFGYDYYHELFKEIRYNKIKVGLYLECFQLPTKDYIDDIISTFYKEKVLLVISPLSGNEKQRKLNGKNFTNTEFINILEYIKLNNIRLQLYYTRNLYKETKEEFRETYEQIKFIKNEIKLNKKCFFYQNIVIDPLAKMRNLDNIEITYNRFKDYYNYCILEEESDFGFQDYGAISMSKKYEEFKNI